MRTAARVTAEWLERMRSVQVSLVAAELGRPVAPARGSSGGAVYGCPSCNSDRRHTKSRDKRGSVGLVQSGMGWRCFQCDASGDALDFVAYAMRGQKLGELGDAGKDEVRAWCQRWLGLDCSAPSTGARPKPVAPAPPVMRAPVYPPEAEVRAVWDACIRVDEAYEVASWFAARRIDATAVADADLARALPAGMRMPRWAWSRAGSWLASGHRLVAQMVDARGVVRSLLARRVVTGRPDEPKSAAASGYQRGGLVLACGLARQVLATGAAPDWWSGPLRFEIAEGEKKWMLRASRYSDANAYAPACIGVESGSWKPEHAARLPDGAEIFIATDPDEQGAKYATAIVAALIERIRSRSVSVELRPEHELHVAANGECKVRMRG